MNAATLLRSFPAGRRQRRLTPPPPAIPRLRFWLALALLGWISPAPLVAQTNLISARENDGTEVEVISVFGTSLIPADGFMPLTVRLTNPSARPRQWNLSVQVQSRSSWGSSTDVVSGTQVNLLAPPGQTTSHEVLVPLPGEQRNSRGLAITTTIRSGGIRHDEWASIDTPRGPSAVLLTQPVARLNLDDLNARARSITTDWSFATRVQAPELPRDWRGLSGWTALFITDAEWDGLSPDQRLAVRQWLRLGGRLLLFTESDPEALLRRVAGRDVTGQTRPFTPDSDSGLIANFSLGRIEVLSWDGGSLDADEVVARFRGGGDETLVSGRFTDSVDDSSLLPPLSSGNFLFGFLLVAYCVIIGPINLYLLAPAARRHRLFATTPLIAIAATVVLVGLGVLRDGIGVRGTRAVVVELRPDESMAYLRQVQMYRSGMVGGTSFDTPQPTLIKPEGLGRAPGARRINLRDSSWSGDLFGSRERAGHELAATRATRERLDWLPADANHPEPRVSSTLAWPLDEVWVHSADGRWWRSGERLAPGGEVTLTEVHSDADSRLNELMAGSPLVDHPHMANMLRERGRFVGFTQSDGDPVAIPTLASVRWLKTEVLTTGPIGGRGTPAPDAGTAAGAGRDETPTTGGGGS